MRIWCSRTPPIWSAGTASRCSTGRSAIPTPRPMRSAARCIPPDRDVRPFQDVLLDLGARLRLPGMIDGHGKALYPGGLKDYIVWHERRPGIGMLAGWRGARRGQAGQGRAEPPAARALYRERLLLARRDSRKGAILPPRQWRLSSNGRSRAACWTSRSRSCCSFIPSRCASSSSPREGFGTRAAAGGRARALTPGLRSAAGLVSRRSSAARRASDGYPPACHHPAADAHVPFLGLRRMPGCGRSSRATALFVIAKPGARLGLTDGDWVWIGARTGA